MAMPAMPAMPMEEMEETEMEEILLIKLTKQMAHRSMPQIFIWRLILWVFCPRNLETTLMLGHSNLDSAESMGGIFQITTWYGFRLAIWYDMVQPGILEFFRK